MLMSPPLIITSDPLLHRRAHIYVDASEEEEGDHIGGVLFIEAEDGAGWDRLAFSAPVPESFR